MDIHVLIKKELQLKMEPPALNPADIPLPESTFMTHQVPLLLQRFEISCCSEGFSSEYFIRDRRNAEEISYALIFCLNQFAHHIHVSKFHPELYKQANTHYLSAACFYLLVHHFAQHYGVTSAFTIFLQTRPAIFEHFYALLRDFDFHVQAHGLGDTVDVSSCFRPRRVKTEMIVEKPAAGFAFLPE
jgi:hypothetical protein